MAELYFYLRRREYRRAIPYRGVALSFRKPRIYSFSGTFAKTSAQAADTTSTVVFWITQRALKPTWSIVTFDEIPGGFNYLMGVCPLSYYSR